MRLSAAVGFNGANAGRLGAVSENPVAQGTSALPPMPTKPSGPRSAGGGPCLICLSRCQPASRSGRRRPYASVRSMSGLRLIPRPGISLVSRHLHRPEQSRSLPIDGPSPEPNYPAEISCHVNLGPCGIGGPDPTRPLGSSPPAALCPRAFRGAPVHTPDPFRKGRPERSLLGAVPVQSRRSSRRSVRPVRRS